MIGALPELFFYLFCIRPLAPAEEEFDFQTKYDGLNDDVRGDFLRPPHGTTPATVE